MISSPEVWKDFLEQYYRDDLAKLAANKEYNGTSSLYITCVGGKNGKDLIYCKEGRLLDELLDYPDIVLDHANKGLVEADNIHNTSLEGCSVRICSLPEARKIEPRKLRSSHMSKMVAIDGIVRKATEVRPRIISATFVCTSCQVKVFVDQIPKMGNIKYPYECRSCGSKKFVLLEEESYCVDSQRLKIQEFPENLRGGEQPQSKDVIVVGDITGMVSPGDRVIINGIIKGYPRYIRGRQVQDLDTFIEASSIEVVDKDYDDFEITEEEKQKILELSKDPDIYGKIIRSVAPVIYGYEEQKQAIAMQLFGGIPKKLPDGTELRGDIHVLLVGDPGISKSQILRYMNKIAPRSVYTTGKGTTAAGLTCTAVKDEFDGKWTLEAGALVLSDKGMALIDEIDKMRKEEVDSMNEAMEQQTVSVSKGGMNTVLKARCSVLSAANPKYGRFDTHAPLPDQVDLPPTLLSRFDFIFIMVDEPNEDKDIRLAKHVLDTHRVGEHLARAKEKESVEPYENIEPDIDIDLLKKYISYARNNIFPVLTDEAMERIEKYYVSLRSKVKEGSPMPVTARQLEAIVRLAESCARMELRTEVNVNDVIRATTIVDRCLEQIATNPEGEVEYDYAFGTAKNERDRIYTIKEIVKNNEDFYDKGVPEEDIVEEAIKQGIDEKKAREILAKMNQKAEVYCPKPNHYRLPDR